MNILITLGSMECPQLTSIVYASLCIKAVKTLDDACLNLLETLLLTESRNVASLGRCPKLGYFAL